MMSNTKRGMMGNCKATMQRRFVKQAALEKKERAAERFRVVADAVKASQKKRVLFASFRTWQAAAAAAAQLAAVKRAEEAAAVAAAVVAACNRAKVARELAPSLTGVWAKKAILAARPGWELMKAELAEAFAGRQEQKLRSPV